jgi:TfoX/Sxy family transcriptional regulator of competence genes
MKQAMRKARSSVPADHGAFDAIVEEHMRASSVEVGKMFGSIALKAHGKVFAMLVKGSMVVKLPADRAQFLVSSGKASPFDPGHGRVMKEWVTIAPSKAASWAQFAAEARVAAEGAARRSKK